MRPFAIYVPTKLRFLSNKNQEMIFVGPTLHTYEYMMIRTMEQSVTSRLFFKGIWPKKAFRIILDIRL